MPTITLPQTADRNVASSSLNAADLPHVHPAGLYVHIPFCFHKCHYCDFYSITGQDEERMERFVELILAEAEHWTEDRDGPTPKPRTIFFGGGTPTLLPPRLMQRLVTGLQQRFDFSGVEEWSVEANPATVTAEYCELLRSLGVDRLSFGAQSFHERELKTLERHHDPEDVPRSLELARGAKFERLNVDLIYAIPGQTTADWSQSLEMAIALKTSHLSCYGLTYEPNTAITMKKKLGLLTSVEEQVELEMFHLARGRLKSVGMPAYEISNYSADGQACRHNLLYWHGGDYIALGPSGASHVQGVRWKNRPNLRDWESTLVAGDLAAMDVERLTADQRAGELAMLALRLEEGLIFDDFAARTGCDARIVYADCIERFTRVGLIELSAGGLRLTKAGLNVADAVALEFLR